MGLINPINDDIGDRSKFAENLVIYEKTNAKFSVLLLRRFSSLLFYSEFWLSIQIKVIDCLYFHMK